MTAMWATLLLSLLLHVGYGKTGNSPPSPPRSHITTPDKYKALFVWHFNDTDNVLTLASYQNELITTCRNGGFNLVFLGVEPFLSPMYRNSSTIWGVQNLVAKLHNAGLQVYALMGQGGPYGDGYARSPVGYGTNKQWTITNIIKPIADYNATAPANSRFTGFLMDNEYYNTGTYSSQEPIGTCDLLKTARTMLPGLKIGHTPNWLLTDPNIAMTVTYDGYSKLEGFHILDQCDFVVVQTYRDGYTLQVPRFDPWFEYVLKSTKNTQLFMASSVETDIEALYTYNHLTTGDKVNLWNNLNTVSSMYQTKSGTRSIWMGNAIEMFDAYLTLK